LRFVLAALTLAFAVAPALADPPPTPVPPPAASPATASPAPSATGKATASPSSALPPVYVKGQVLTIASGYLIFTSGDAVRLQDGLAIPSGVTTGSYVRITLDQVIRRVTEIELEPKITLAGEVDAANIPRQYVVVSPKSAPLPAPTGQSAANQGGFVDVTIVVHVPGNTPPSDDVYLSTERSSYSPSEIRMQRVDGTTFSVSMSLAANTTLKYEFTRGTYATVERDRTGGIVSPHLLNATPNGKTDDTVIRWADIS
jgi:hypothetical protein